MRTLLTRMALGTWIVTALCIHWAGAQNLSVNGVALLLGGPSSVAAGGKEIILHELPSGKRSVLHRGNGIYAPTFSPNGRSIAWVEEGTLCTMDNDGTNIREICSINAKNMDFFTLSWRESGTLYWSDWSNNIYKVSADGTNRKTQCSITIHSISAGKPYGPGDGIIGLVVTKKERFASSISRGQDRAYYLDIIDGKILGERVGSCQGYISPCGTYIGRPTEGSEAGYIRIQNVPDWGIYKDHPEPPMFTHAGDRFGSQSDDFLFLQNRQNRGTLVMNVHSGEWVELVSGGGWQIGKDLWIGNLPDPDGPTLTLHIGKKTYAPPVTTVRVFDLTGRMLHPFSPYPAVQLTIGHTAGTMGSCALPGLATAGSN